MENIVRRYSPIFFHLRRVLLFCLMVLVLSGCPRDRDANKEIGHPLEGSRWQLTQHMFLTYNSHFGCESFEFHSCEPDLATGTWLHEVTAEFVVGQLDSEYADLQFENVRGSHRFSDYPQWERDEWRHYSCEGYSTGASFTEFSTTGAYGPWFLSGEFIPGVFESIDETQGDPGPFFQFQIIPGGVVAGYTTPCTLTEYDGYGGSRTTDWDDLRDKTPNITIGHVVPAENGSVTHQPAAEATHLSGSYTLRWQCVENCHNDDCSEQCDDGNDCTDDHCVPGQDCVHEPRSLGPCDDGDECTNSGVCREGVCQPGPELDCDDENPCTYDTCHSAYGCLHDENIAPLENADPRDCWKQICVKGIPHDVPDDSETPWQLSPTDCYAEVCLNGVLSLPDDREVPPQNSPTDCYREYCEEGEIVSYYDDSEPGC